MLLNKNWFWKIKIVLYDLLQFIFYKLIVILEKYTAIKLVFFCFFRFFLSNY